MFFSIIIPVYNTQSYLRVCLESVLRQNLKKGDYEVIIVDDGSTDQSADIYREYYDRNPEIIKYYKKDNGGLSSARNYALQRGVSGKYVLFLDSDDYYIEGFLYKLKDLIAKQGEYDIYEFGYQGICGAGDTVVSKYIPNTQQNISFPLTGKEYLKYVLSVKGYYEWFPWKYAIKKEILEDKRFPLGLCYEDVYFMPRILNSANTVYPVKIEGYKYRMGRANAITTETKLQTEMDKLAVIKSNIEYFATLEDKELKDQLCGNFSNLYYSALIRAYDLKEAEREKLLVTLRDDVNLSNYAVGRKQRIIKHMIRILGVKKTSFLLHIRKCIREQ